MKTVLKIEGLSKNFGKRTIIDNVSLETTSGEVFGFLGPNGAGKTTTIKMLTGLLYSDGGKISVCGYDLKKNYEKAMGQIGAIVENPELYGHLTGLQNLRYFARMKSGITKERITEVTELVGLSGRINDKVSKYSLGMKQRLGIAVCVLHSPALLVLDEPTNGLDPEGIRLLRDVTKKLAHEEGICVFVSSHLMGEMEMMCDRVGIVIDGKMVDVKTVDELVGSFSNMGQQEYKITLDDTSKASALLTSNGYSITGVNHTTVTVSCDKKDLPVLNKLIVQSDILLELVEPVDKKHLEDVFLEMTKREGNQIA